MKKHTISLVIAILAGAFISVSALSAKGYGMAGCGLGSMVIGPKGGIVQIFAVTTNGTSYSQFFGITSGTSNCTQSAAAFNERRQQIFVHVNIKSLEHEMAAGKGEKLKAFAGLLGCPASQTVAFGKMTRKNYSNLARHMDNPSKLLTAVKHSVATTGALNSCKVI